MVDAAAAAGTDRAALIALYAATDGPNWKNDDNWLSGAPLRNWHGVDTDSRGRVSRLVLHANGLTGPIPSELGSLASLRTLALGFNGLTGPIPAEFSKLSQLRELSVYYNHLTGFIPSWLGRLRDLELVQLSDNYLMGSIPADLGGLARMRKLQLQGNGLTGLIPHELGELSRLEELDLSQNNISGALPPQLGQLSILRRLGLADNRQLSGPLPRDFTRLHRVEKLTARGTGSLPAGGLRIPEVDCDHPGSERSPIAGTTIHPCSILHT